MSEKKKNAIWIMSDQHRAHMLSCNGDPNATTPNIDNMAVYGMNFRSAVSGFPLCCPFRGSMFSSVYPHKCVPGHQYRMPEGQKTITHVFKENGYYTSYFGKWHLDGFQESDGRAALHVVPPERRGDFDYWLGYENNNSQWDSWVHGGAAGDATKSFRLPKYETDALTDLFIDHIKDLAKANKPFFSVLSVQPPHNPYAAPPEFMKDYNPATIAMRPNVPDIATVQEKARREISGAYAMVENLDHNIGRIIECLREEGLLEDTHILFFSDHGDMHGSHGQFLKTNPFEESIRVPFIISGEQPTYDGRECGISHAPINHVDIAPTTLGLCGIEKPNFMEGTDYSWHRLSTRPRANEPDSAYLQSVIPTKHPDSTDKPWRGLVTTDGWKYVCFEQMEWLLFNLNEDPYEQMNLAHNVVYRPKLQELNDRLKKWADDTDDVFNFPTI